MARAHGGQDAPSGRASKGQRRIEAILAGLPDAREQLIVAKEEFGDFDVEALISAAQSDDARQRNKVAALERDLENIINRLDELASRGLAEAQRRGIIEKESGYPWERLAGLKIISRRTAERLQEAKELRDDLQHAYPNVRWLELHTAVEDVLAELDRYVKRFDDWARKNGVLP